MSMMQTVADLFTDSDSLSDPPESPSRSLTSFRSRPPRRQCIPMLYTKGTHYEVGFDVGRTFASIIKEFLEKSSTLNNLYLPISRTRRGREVYDETLRSVQNSFPQYVRELEGIADGAAVEFFKLFLLHMDDILPNLAEQQCKNTYIATGCSCSTIVINERECEIIAHTEDALQEVQNHFYIVSAHIIDPTFKRKYDIVEEKFTSLCYAGHLPGYTMGFNHHGMVYTTNTLSAEALSCGKTPRHFLTRALLSSQTVEMAEEILYDYGVGAANGCSINLAFVKRKRRRVYYNFEMGPCKVEEIESQIAMARYKRGQGYIHLNKYLHLPIKEVDGPIVHSSNERLKVLASYGTPKCKEDAIEMLGDQSGETYSVFSENGDEQTVKTLAFGIFDIKRRTWSIYADNPKFSKPLIVLPLLVN